MTSLKIADIQGKTDVPKMEHDVLAFWDESKAFETSVTSRPDSKRYVFYDGPPFATGLPHYGHILASTIKDVIPRYFTMKGYRVERVWGWDCHGIPIENIIEKELDLKGGKKGIEALGIDKFNAACRSAILRFDKEWEKIVHRIGRWVDFKHSYKTMDRSYMESVWWAFQSLYKKSLVYQGRKVILYCPRCATPLSNFEIAMDNSYKDISDIATTYKFKLAGAPKTYLLAWSTTPWNKLVTTALAVNPDLQYVYAKQGDETYIIAETRLSTLIHKPYEIVKKVKGSELHGLNYEALYDFYPKRKPGEQAFIVVADDYVTAGEGTGVVTLAVYGEEDYRVMKHHHIQLAEHVDSEGKLRPEVTPWAGMDILKANPLIDEELQKRGLIYKKETVIHSVPMCYRCETRLYYAPIPAWFIDIQKMKKDLIKQNEHIHWYPDYLKHGRFGKGLEQAPDWNISRSRYWGTPMPIWVSHKVRKVESHKDEKEYMRIIGSIEELKKWAVEPEKVKNLPDIHREYVDDIELWVDEGRTIKGKRIPDVFDCWVESGSMPYASIHYPFEHKELFASTHPAQFISEYIAQTRAWFYTLHVMSVGLFDTHTFEHALTTGTIMAEDGSKLSKSKKNFPDPSLFIEKYGVDALRFYLMGSVVMKAENINFSESSVREVYQKVIIILWNVFTFYALYAGAATAGVPKPIHILDRWIVSRTNTLVRNVTRAMDGYDTLAACREITVFINDLSTWYLRRSRNRIKTDGVSRQVCGWVLVSLAKVMAPITPFISELLYQNVTDDTQSVHLTSWPTVGDYRDVALENDMTYIRLIVEKIHAERKMVGIPVRQPLSSVIIHPDRKQLSPELAQLILEEVNVKSVVWAREEKEIRIELDTNITSELKNEGKAREVIRIVQELRKARGCKVSDTITLRLPKEYHGLPKPLVEQIQKETFATSIIWGESIDILT